MQSIQTYNFLNFVHFKDVNLWDVKRVSLNKIASIYPIVKLGDYIEEQSSKFKLFEYTQKEFKILGVNNKTGLFDAYIEKGSNINQAYKKMEYGWLAYNPYRINVGSIGYKHASIRYEYISPAYVVFSCKEKLLPEFLYILFKTNYFNKIIRDNTTGSVRQNLSYENLSSLNIPLPTLAEQKQLVSDYHYTVDLAKQREEEAESLKSKCIELFYKNVGVHIDTSSKGKVTSKIAFIKYSNINRWAISHILKRQQFSTSNSSYKRLPIKNVLLGFEGGKTPKTSRTDYWNGDINWASPKDFSGLEVSTTEDRITQKAVKETGLNIFPAGTILSVFRSGILRHSFPVAITKIPVTINQDLKAMTVNSSLLTKEYFLYYLHFMQRHILEKSAKIGVTVESINTDEFLSIEVVIPPIERQKEIANEVNIALGEVRTLLIDSNSLTLKAQQDFEKSIFQ